MYFVQPTKPTPKGGGGSGGGPGALQLPPERNRDAAAGERPRHVGAQQSRGAEILITELELKWRGAACIYAAHNHLAHCRQEQ